METGAPINGFTFNYIKYEVPLGKILQFQDEVAIELLSTYDFLQDLTRSEVDQALKKISEQYKCTYCEKSFALEIALKGHMRSHKDEKLEEEAPIDPSIVPVAAGNPTNAFLGPNVPQMQRGANPEQVKLKNDETENDSFYGEGYQESHGK